MLGCVQAGLLGGSVKASPYLVYYGGTIDTAATPDEIVDSENLLNLQVLSGTVTTDGDVITFGGTTPYAKSVGLLSGLLGATKFEIEIRLKLNATATVQDFVSAAEVNKRMFTVRLQTSSFIRCYVCGTATGISDYVQWSNPFTVSGALIKLRIVYDGTLGGTGGIDRLTAYVDDVLHTTNKTVVGTIPAALQNTAASSLQMSGFAGGATNTLQGQVDYAWIKRVA